jgi:tetratricopeptide (TPR) repeat protein
MIKRILFTAIILAFLIPTNSLATVSDSTNTTELTAYDWKPISDINKLLQYENTKQLSKRSIDQSKLAEPHYIAGVELMLKKEYAGAIKEFKSAMKRYKRAKISNDALNFIHINMALCYANTGNKEDIAVSKRFLGLITPKAYNAVNWAYNISIAHHKVGNSNEAASILSAAIRKDEFYFQAYITLEDIYRSSGNHKDADKVLERMEKVEDKLITQNEKENTKEQTKNRERSKKKGVVLSPKGERPDVSNLKIVSEDNPLQFNKVNKINDRSMAQIQEGIGEYNLGVSALNNKEYKISQTHLKNAEKRLKRGKITEDGLNFTRGNLAISYLASGEKRGVGQAKRYLRFLTKRIFKTREWTYNLAVAHYAFAEKSRGATKKEYTEKTIKLFKSSIKQDKLFLPAYQNLIYVYKELKDERNALKTHRAYEKSRERLMKSFSKKDQMAQGGDPYIFRLNLGTFDEYNTPITIFDEKSLITVPVTEKETTYLAGLFYTLDEVSLYQKEMLKEGYSHCFIVAFKDGEKLEF